MNSGLLWGRCDLLISWTKPIQDFHCLISRLLWRQGWKCVRRSLRHPSVSADPHRITSLRRQFEMMPLVEGQTQEKLTPSPLSLRYFISTSNDVVTDVCWRHFPLHNVSLHTHFNGMYTSYIHRIFYHVHSGKSSCETVVDTLVARNLLLVTHTHGSFSGKLVLLTMKTHLWSFFHLPNRSPQKSVLKVYDGFW